MTEKTKLYLNFFMGFLIPPPAWFALNYLAGTFNVEMIISMLLFPILYIYVGLYTYINFRVFNKRIKRMEKNLLSNDPETVTTTQKDLIFIQNHFMISLMLYVIVGPVLVLSNVYNEVDQYSFFVIWLSGIPLISIYSSPFVIGFLRSLGRYASELPFHSEYRAMNFSKKIFIILGQNTIGVILVIMLFLFYLQHIYGAEDDFQLILLNRMSIVAGTSLLIIIVNLFLFSRSFSVPIGQLRDRVGELAVSTSRANLTTRLEVMSRDELGEIAYSFNRFSEKIRTVILSSNEVSINVSNAAEDITRLTEIFNKNTSEQSESMEHITAALEEIYASVDNVAHVAEMQKGEIVGLVELLKSWDTITEEMSSRFINVTELSEKTAEKARLGDEALQKTNNSILSIDESARKITDVVNIIQDISEKVDLLALNAAIEAARAGESGRGFAVVAEEISRLAVKTAESIKEIDQLVLANSGQVQDGVKHVKDTLHIIQSIMQATQDSSSNIHDLDRLVNKQINVNTQVQTSAEHVSKLALEIEQTTNEQRVSIESVNGLLENVNKVSHNTGEMAETLLADAKVNQSLSRQLKDNVEIFDV